MIPQGNTAGSAVDSTGTGSVTGQPEGGGRLPGPRISLPLARPRLTFVLLALIAAAFGAEMIAGGSTDGEVLVRLGAQVNPLVASGEPWRLLTAMFLHIGLQHIAFNAWALFSLGRDVEAFYGPLWFVAIYAVAGLCGNVAYYLLGQDGISAGASGAIFGLIGAELAFFLSNRALFGRFGRERLANLAVLIGINLIFGFTVPGINNIAHLGGLVGGATLGLVLAPRYRVTWVQTENRITGRLRDMRAPGVRVIAVAVAVVLLALGFYVGQKVWAGHPSVLFQSADAAYESGDLAETQRLLEQVVALDPENVSALYNLGVVYLRQDRVARATEALERALTLAPDDLNTLLILGAAYWEQGRTAEARPLLERFLAQEPTGGRAEYALSILANSP